MVKQIKELRAKDHLTEQILHALSTDEKVPEILDRLKNGETYESIVEWLGRSPMEDFETLSPKESQHSTFEASDQEMGGVSSTSFRWTTVTSNKAILDHLFQLYFAWVHPVHTLFSEGHFVDSYKWNADNYCSPALVNAICAMACHLHCTSEGDGIDFEQLEGEFSDAARADIDCEDKRITTIQAFAVMFLVDCARANLLRAAAYLRVATNKLSGISWLDNEGFSEVWKNTVRGVRNLNVEWAQATFQVSPTIVAAPVEGVEENDNILDNTKWYFYRSVNDQCPAWPSLLATTNREKSKLFAIINDVVTKLYTPGGKGLTANDVLHLYSRFIAWREELPSSIGNIESPASQALPHVLSLLILYSNAVIQLLRPLLDYDGFPSTLVEEIVWKTAQEGLSLLDEHYRTQYTCRYQPVLQMFGVLHLTDVICRFFPNNVDGPSKDGSTAIQLGMEVLMQSWPGFPVAGPFQAMLRRTANECSVPLPKNIPGLLISPRPPKQRYGIDDIIDACTRPSYVQPVGEIHNKYLASFSMEWASNGGSYGFLEPSSGKRLRGLSAEERGAQSLMQIRNLLNTN